MEPIRILHFPGIFISGGVETVLINWYKNIDRSKIQFDFCVIRKDRQPIDDVVESLGGRVIYLSRIRSTGIVKSIQSIRKIIRQYGPYKAVHIHSVHAGVIPLIAAQLAGIKTRVYHVHSTKDLALQNTKGRFLIEKCSQYIINKYSTIRCACSKDAGKYVYGNCKFQIINNAIDLNRFRPWNSEEREKQRKEYSFSNNDIVVGYVARFVEGKNHELLLDIAQQAKKRDINLKFFLVGDGPCKSRIKEMIETRGLSSYFVLPGYIQDTEKVYNSLDIFCIPSNFEGLSLVTIEAQACGIPCLISSGVPQEVALDVTAVAQENLCTDSSGWLDRLLSLINKRVTNGDMIKKVFSEKGYEISSVIDNLNSIYLD